MTNKQKVIIAVSGILGFITLASFIAQPHPPSPQPAQPTEKEVLESRLGPTQAARTMAAEARAAKMTPAERAADLEKKTGIKNQADCDTCESGGEIDVKVGIGVAELRREMRDPDSFRVNRVLVMGAGKKAAVCYEYQARNGFGGMNQATTVLTPTGILSSSDETWNKYCGGKTGRDYTSSYFVTHDLSPLLH